MAVELETKRKFLNEVFFNARIREWQEKHVAAIAYVSGNCLEGAGLEDGKMIVIEYGYFDYQPGDIVYFEDLEGHKMLKEFSHWVAPGVAIMRTRYLDPAKDFEIMTVKSLMYGKVFRGQKK